MQKQADFVFAFERLEVYQLSRELTRETRRVAALIPRGNADVTDQLRRSGGAVARLISEGALRPTRGAKRQRFSEALGECGEAVATAQQALDLMLIAEPDYLALRRIACRVAAMTTRLVTKFS